MAHCYPTDLSSGTYNLYDSAKNVDDQPFPGSLQYNVGWPLDYTSDVILLNWRNILCNFPSFFMLLVSCSHIHIHECKPISLPGTQS